MTQEQWVREVVSLGALVVVPGVVRDIFQEGILGTHEAHA